VTELEKGLHRRCPSRPTIKTMVVFKRLLANTLLSSASGAFLWFALTFWVYLETKSVVTTAMIGGAFALIAAFSGLFFGTFVDRHRKKYVMVVSSIISLAFFAIAALVYKFQGDGLLRLRNPYFWCFIVATLIGAVAGNLRAIALSTCVTLLIPEDQRDKANGLLGTVNGLSFTLTSVFSGLVIGRLGMGWALAFGIVGTALALIHLFSVHVDEADPSAGKLETGEPTKWIDFAGARAAIHQTRGLMALIMFAAFNNLLGGVFMSLMDAYGLELMSVEAWGIMFAVLSVGFIVGGLIVSKKGLGPNPLRVIMIGNLFNWIICMFFTIQASIALMAVGMMIWMTMMPIIEAAEQTVLQRAVPFESQGRVFGFAQTIENLASPLTSFMIGPIAELFFIPFMTTGRGVDLIGSWFGVGQGRGIALIFTAAGMLGVIGTLIARSSKSYRYLSASTTASTTTASE
jgi:MFS transporter, DHA3 family, multidrug efflux protein